KKKAKDAFFRRIEEAAGIRDRAVEVKFTDRSRIVVKALLNGRVETRLLVDTGATLVYFSPKIAEKLEMKTAGKKRAPIKLADGNVLYGIPVRLRSVKVGNAEAVDVSAVVLPEEFTGLYKKDDVNGILGMSFLNRFHIKIDTSENILTLSPK
ncbi:MAG: retroviral-like aspartic protease family protein, partial [Candidatus Omnitrophica bacterium]|nr:retroviral-like aspartic protease family protein [Candidatus Omnitrophota bacterium]